MASRAPPNRRDLTGPGFFSPKEFSPRSLPRHSVAAVSENRGHSQNAFFRHDGIYRSDVFTKPKPKPKPCKPEGGVPPPVGRPPSPSKRTRRKDRALPIVHDEFRPAIPRSGCSPALPVSASPAWPE